MDKFICYACKELFDTIDGFQEHLPCPALTVVVITPKGRAYLAKLDKAKQNKKRIRPT